MSNSLMLILCLTSVEIDKENYVPNRIGKVELGYCTWASIETAARQNKVKPLIGLVSRRYKQNRVIVDPGYTESVRKQLDICNINYILRNDGTFDKEQLSKYAESHGVVTTIVAGNEFSRNTAHSILITKYGDTVEFYDCTAPRMWKCDKRWFDTWWSGNAVIVLGEK